MKSKMSEQEARSCRGLRVRTADKIDLIRRGWLHPRHVRAASRGTIVDHSNSHGLCFKVKHSDGAEYWYDPDELS